MAENIHPNNPFSQIYDELADLKNMVQDLFKILNQPTSQQNSSEFLNIDEACKFLNCKKPTIYKKVRSGLLPHSKTSGKLLFEKSDLIAWLKSGKTATQENVTNQLRDYLNKHSI